MVQSDRSLAAQTVASAVDTAASGAASRNAAGTALRASLESGETDAGAALDRATDGVAGAIDRAEYNPDTDPGYGDRSPENRTPERLRERRFQTIAALSKMQADLGGLIQSLAAEQIDSNQALNNFTLSTGTLTRRLGSTLGMAGDLARDMLRTLDEQGGRPPARFANSAAFRRFNQRTS